MWSYIKLSIDFKNEQWSALMDRYRVNIYLLANNLYSLMLTEQIMCFDVFFNKQTGAILIDLEKAFDSKWNPDLTYKLIHLRYLPISLSSTEYLTPIRTKGGFRQEWFPRDPQDTIPGPYYSIFSTDITVFILSTKNRRNTSAETPRPCHQVSQGMEAEIKAIKQKQSSFWYVYRNWETKCCWKVAS